MSKLEGLDELMDALEARERELGAALVELMQLGGDEQLADQINALIEAQTADVQRLDGPLSEVDWDNIDPELKVQLKRVARFLVRPESRSEGHDEAA